MASTSEGRTRKSLRLSNLRKLLYEIQEKGLGGKAVDIVRGEIDYLMQEVRGLSSRMSNYATKDDVDRISNDVAEIKRVMLSSASRKNEVRNNCGDRVDASEIGQRHKSSKECAYQKVNVEDLCHSRRLVS